MNGYSQGRPPRLILVDGLAGTGKSTTAQRLWLQLKSCGHDAVWFHEHDSRHPIFHFSSLEELPGLVTASLWNDIVANWKALARDSGVGPIRVLEGTLLQTSVGVLLSQNVDADRIMAMVLMIAGLVRDRDAAVVYLRLSDTSAWLSRNMRNRGRDWVDRMAGLLAQTPYGQQGRAQGVQMLLEFYREQQRIIEAIVAELPLKKAVIDVDDDGWPDAYREMSEFLGMGALMTLDMPNGELSRFVGTFRGASTGSECVIEAQSESLFMRFSEAEPAVRLLPVMPSLREFCLQSVPVTIQFDSDDIDTVRGFSCDVRVPEPRLADGRWRRAG